MEVPKEAKQGLDGFAKAFEKVMKIADAEQQKTLREVKKMVQNVDEKGLQDLIKRLKK